MIPVSRADLPLAVAQALAAAAVDAALREGLAICAVAADSAGLPLAVLRMDGVAEPFLTFATDKAWTAATLRRTTEALRERMQTDPLRLGSANRERLMLWGGGVPVFHKGQCIGGLGISGGTVAQDIACAMAALAALGLPQG